GVFGRANLEAVRRELEPAFIPRRLVSWLLVLPFGGEWAVLNGRACQNPAPVAEDLQVDNLQVIEDGLQFGLLKHIRRFGDGGDDPAQPGEVLLEGYVLDARGVDILHGI